MHAYNKRSVLREKHVLQCDRLRYASVEVEGVERQVVVVAVVWEKESCDCVELSAMSQVMVFVEGPESSSRMRLAEQAAISCAYL